MFQFILYNNQHLCLLFCKSVTMYQKLIAECFNSNCLFLTIQSLTLILSDVKYSFKSSRSPSTSYSKYIPINTVKTYSASKPFVDIIHNLIKNFFYYMSTIKHYAFPYKGFWTCLINRTLYQQKEFWPGAE